jgi:hypothetical protein
LLCYKCSNRMYTCDVGNCQSCGSFTSSGSFNLCAKCAADKNECASCGGKLDAVKPPTPPDAKVAFILGVDKDLYLAAMPQQVDRKDFIARHEAAIESFKKDLAEWLKARGQQEDAVEVRNEFKALAMLLIVCTESTAEALRTMPGVANLSANE